MQRGEYWRRMAVSVNREATLMAITCDLAALVEKGTIGKIEAVDLLYELAQSHGLISALGNDRVQELLARGFSWRAS